MRTPNGARGEQSSDGEGRRAGWIWLDRICGKNDLRGRRADRMRVAGEPLRQRRQVWRDIRHGLSGEAAEGTLIAAMAMAGRRVLAGRAVIIDVGAQLRRIAEDRLELGHDRRVIGAGECGRSERGRRGGGEQLDDEREHDEESG